MVVSLYPEFLLDDNWKTERSLPFSHGIRLDRYEPSTFEILRSKFKRKTVEEQENQEAMNQLRQVRIEVAEKAKTNKISSDENSDYLKSELGMNIILPKGSIDELRFKVKLESEQDSNELMAIDGFPKDVIEEKHIVDGKITIYVNKLFKFIPVLGTLIEEIVDVEFKPWDFKVGNLKKINVDFGGGLTTTPEWYFKKNGIQNELRVGLIIKKPKKISKVNSYVDARWLYDPGFFEKIRAGTDSKMIEIYKS